MSATGQHRKVRYRHYWWFVALVLAFLWEMLGGGWGHLIGETLLARALTMALVLVSYVVYGIVIHARLSQFRGPNGEEWESDKAFAWLIPPIDLNIIAKGPNTRRILGYLVILLGGSQFSLLALFIYRAFVSDFLSELTTEEHHELRIGVIVAFFGVVFQGVGSGLLRMYKWALSYTVVEEPVKSKQTEQQRNHKGRTANVLTRKLKKRGAKKRGRKH